MGFLSAHLSNPEPILAMPQANSFDSILEQCRDLVCERVADALSKMLDEADGALTTFEVGARDPETQKLYQVTRNKVLAQRDTIVTQFRMRFLREVQERGNRVKKIGDQFAEIDLSSLELELVSEDNLDESLKFNAMASKVRQYCDEELVALDQRVGVLIGDADLQSEDNPLTPQAICDAYKQTCRQVDSNVDVRMVLLRLFDDHVLDEMRAVYKAVNALLIQNSILPKIRFSVARGKDGAKGPPSGAKQSEQSATAGAQTANELPGSEQDLFAQLQTLLASNLQTLAQHGGASAAGANADGSAGLQNAELLGSLTRIQLGDASGLTGGVLPPAVVAGAPGTTNILQELKNTSLGSGMNQMDAMTLDIMAMLFDELFDDPKIPTSVKGLIGWLQIPLLKVAIADKSFFSKKSHPARQVLDKLGELSAGLPADISESDPIYENLESILQDVIEGFEDDIKIFDDLRERLEALIAEANERVEEKTQSIAKQVEQEESLALAKTVAQAEIKVRVRASAAPLPVIEFLAQQWVKLLIVIQVKEGENSEAWKAALETVDLLLWSSEPKETIAERQKLVALVPDLHKRLSAGLSNAGIDDETRVQFMTDLRKLHAQIIGSSAEPKSEAPTEEPAIDDKSEETGTDVESSEPEASEEPEAPEVAVDPGEAVATANSEKCDVTDMSLDASVVIEPEEPESTAKPEAADSSDHAMALDSTAMLESGEEAENTQESGIIATPDEGETATIPEQAQTSQPSPTTSAEKLQMPNSAAPTGEFESEPTHTTGKDAATKTSPEADSQAPTLEFVAETKETAKQEEPAEEGAEPTAESLSESASASERAAQKNPAAPQKQAASAPVSEKQMQPAAAPATKPATTQQAPTPAKTSQSVPAKSTKPAIARSVRAPTQTVQPVAASAVKSRASGDGAGTNSRSVDLNAPVVVKNPFGEGEVEVNDLDFTDFLKDKSAKPDADKGKSARRQADYAGIPSELAEGSWVEIRDKGGSDKATRAKLSIVSPLKTRFVFVTQQGRTVLDCSRAELACRFEVGEVVLSTEEPEASLFDRLAGGLVGKLGGKKS
ncbi:MAG: DUF1631 family protein [Pseudomonadales bacterium]